MRRATTLLLSAAWALTLGVTGPASARLVAGPAGDPDSTAGPPVVTARSSGTAARSDNEPRRFWVKDKRRYASRWFAGRHRIMIGYGCTRAPYYAADPRCSGERGFHHGIDIAMRCGTRLFAGVRARVVEPTSAGALGPAYGERAFRLRSRRHYLDVVIGHVRRVYVEPGDVVRRGQRIARASDAGAPDGCHLHFEVRSRGGGVDDAVRPRALLRLHRG